MVYLHKENRVVISSYSDVVRLSPNLSEVHFRKFVSRRLILHVFQECGNVRRISISRSAASRCNRSCLEMIKGKKVEIMISDAVGRPNSIKYVGSGVVEDMHLNREEKDII